MSVDIMSCNARDGFSDAANSRKLIEYVNTVNPSVAIFPEAYAEDQDCFMELVLEDFDSAGYVATHGLYDDNDSRTDRHGILAIVHKSVANPDHTTHSLLRLGGRNAVRFSLFDPATDREIEGIGLHLNDRSSAKRAIEITDVRKAVTIDHPTLVVGDFNDMHAETARGVIIAGARLLSKLVDMELMSATEPQSTHDPLSIGKIGSLGKRLYEMASGQAMAMLTEAGFRDIDEKHQPTFPSILPIAQLDHIMTTAHFEKEDFHVSKHTGATDHRAIHATLSLR